MLSSPSIPAPAQHNSLLSGAAPSSINRRKLKKRINFCLQEKISRVKNMSDKSRKTITIRQLKQHTTLKRNGHSKLSTNDHVAKKVRDSTVNSDTHIQDTHGVCISTSRNKVQAMRPLRELRSEPIEDQSRFNFPPYLDPAYYKKNLKVRTSNLVIAKEVTPTSIKATVGTSAMRAEKQCINENMLGQLASKSVQNRRPTNCSTDQMDLTFNAPLSGNPSSISEQYDDIEEEEDELEDHLQETMDNVVDPVHEKEIEPNGVKKSKCFRSRNMKAKSVIPNTNGLSIYDDKQEVLIVDALSTSMT